MNFLKQITAPPPKKRINLMVNVNWRLTMYLEEINEPPRRKKKDESK